MNLPPLILFLVNQNTLGCAWDQSCHLQDNGALFAQHLGNSWHVTVVSNGMCVTVLLITLQGNLSFYCFRNHQPVVLHQPEERDSRQDLHALQRNHAVIAGTPDAP